MPLPSLPNLYHSLCPISVFLLFPSHISVVFHDTLSVPFVQFNTTLHGLVEAILHTSPPPEIPICCPVWSLLLFNCVTAFVKCFFIRHMAQHSFTSPRQRMRIIVVERAHIPCITSHTHALEGMISVLCPFHGVPVCGSFHCICHNNTCNIPNQRMITDCSSHTSSFSSN